MRPTSIITQNCLQLSLHRGDMGLEYAHLVLLRSQICEQPRRSGRGGDEQAATSSACSCLATSRRALDPPNSRPGSDEIVELFPPQVQASTNARSQCSNQGSYPVKMTEQRQPAKLVTLRAGRMSHCMAVLIVCFAG